jgi:DHA1 family tetracycline resistance protein-like MFS transporter
VIAAFSILLLMVPDKSLWLYLIIPFVAILQGMNQPNTSSIISNLAGEDKQGEILGINQSIQAAAQSIPLLIAGFIASANVNLPMIFSAASIMLAWAVFVLFIAGSHTRSITY